MFSNQDWCSYVKKCLQRISFESPSYEVLDLISFVSSFGYNETTV